MCEVPEQDGDFLGYLATRGAVSWRRAVSVRRLLSCLPEIWAEEVHDGQDDSTELSESISNGLYELESLQFGEWSQRQWTRTHLPATSPST